MINQNKYQSMIADMLAKSGLSSEINITEYTNNILTACETEPILKGLDKSYLNYVQRNQDINDQIDELHKAYIDNLKSLLKKHIDREPTIEDYKECTMVSEEGKAFPQIFAYKNVPLAIIEQSEVILGNIPDLKAMMYMTVRPI